MRWLRGGVAPRKWSGVLAVVGLIGLSVAIAGCAISTAEPTASYQAAIAASRDVREDDGLPPQPSPPFRIRQVTDDPSEPFSFNYGPRPPRRLSHAEAEAVIARAITEHEMRKP
jgi:hypothetical protein